MDETMEKLIAALKKLIEEGMDNESETDFKDWTNESAYGTALEDLMNLMGLRAETQVVVKIEPKG